MAKCLLEGCNRQARIKFCCNKHKDRYHNLHNPRGYFAHLKHVKHEDDDFDPNDDPSWDAHKRY